MTGSVSADRIPINGDVLRWARERQNYDIEDAADWLNVRPDRVAAWEAGERAPTVKQARKLAARYDRPFLEFFAREIPDVPETELVPDFRFIRNRVPRETVTLKGIQRWAEELRLNALDLLQMLSEPAPEIPERIHSAITENPENAADRARAEIGPPIEWQFGLNSRTRPQFPVMLRHIFERSGILVLRQSTLQQLNVRGICLYAEPLPIIVFGNEAPGAQAFTLVHELAHVTLRQSAISGAPRLGARAGSKRVEGWCNRFAAAFLMPKAAIEADIQRPTAPMDSFDDETLRNLATRYSVSRHAMLIRLVTLNYVRPAFYWFIKRQEFLKEEEEFEAHGRAPYYGSRYRNSRGDFYTGLVLEAWNGGQITNHNAAEFMGIKNLTHLYDIRSNFET